MFFPLVAARGTRHLPQSEAQAVTCAAIEWKVAKMKKLIWVALAALVVVGGYLWMSAQNAPKSVEETTEPVTGTEALDTATETANEAAAAAEEAAAAATAAAEEAAAAAAKAVTDAAEAAAQAAAEAVEAAAQAATDAATAATEAATTATEAATEAASEAATALTETATDAATDTSDAAPAGAPDVLTVEGFDLAKANEMIETSQLGSTEKMLLSASLEQAQQNPELLNLALQEVRSALGL